MMITQETTETIIRSIRDYLTTSPSSRNASVMLDLEYDKTIIGLTLYADDNHPIDAYQRKISCTYEANGLVYAHVEGMLFGDDYQDNIAPNQTRTSSPEELGMLMERMVESLRQSSRNNPNPATSVASRPSRVRFDTETTTAKNASKWPKKTRMI
jgi:hypothetical protein